MLNFRLEEETVEGRTERLWRRLELEKDNRILIIVDDLWSQFNMMDIGICHVDRHTWKILVVTHNEAHSDQSFYFVVNKDENEEASEDSSSISTDVEDYTYSGSRRKAYNETLNDDSIHMIGSGKIKLQGKSHYDVSKNENNDSQKSSKYEVVVKEEQVDAKVLSHDLDSNVETSIASESESNKLEECEEQMEQEVVIRNSMLVELEKRLQNVDTLQEQSEKLNATPPTPTMTPIMKVTMLFYF
ncbi:disease resistance protein [Trifolium repens]|nr:disease resistance protein [Trifolium repens]